MRHLKKINFLLLLMLFISGTAFAKDFTGLNVLVTGGSRGIGEACALAFAREGANVAIAANHSYEEALSVAEKIKKYDVKVLVYQCDVSKIDQVNAMVDDINRQWEMVHVLVNNAGISKCLPAEELTYEDWKTMIDTNLTGVFLCSQAVGKKMIEKGIGGNIINISSMCGHIVVSPQRACHYHASKGGVGMLTKSLAVEWAEYGIRVNAISPGYIKTKMIEPGEHLFQEWIEKTPLKQIGAPDDIAEAAVYLASPKAKFITGCDWLIDGGYGCY